MIHCLALFFQFPETPQIVAIKETIKQLEKIKWWFAKQRRYRFPSTSIIIAYEARLEETIASLTSNDDKESMASNLVRVKMVDFDRVKLHYRKFDTVFFNTIEILIDHLTQLLEPSYIFKDIRN